MYKVLIIDDEPVVRKGMINVIRWNELGCTVVGEAANGLEGEALILEKKPDIILTDIHMPEMNGLEMIKETLSDVPHAQIIVLTGYRDFDYIQEALRLGAADYLLKPTKLGAIQECVTKAIDVLDERKKHNETLSQLEKLFDQARPVLLEKRLRDIVFNVSPADHSIVDEMRLFGFELKSYYVLLIEMADNLDAYSHQLNKLGLRNAFEESFGKDLEVTPIDIGNRRILFILQSNSQGELSVDHLIERVESFMKMIKEVFDIDFDSALSTYGKALSELYQKSNECIKTIEYKHYLGEGAILLADDFKTENYDDISVMTHYKESFMNAIKVGNVLTTETLLEKNEKSLMKKHTVLKPLIFKIFLLG